VAVTKWLNLKKGKAEKEKRVGQEFSRNATENQKTALEESHHSEMVHVHFNTLQIVFSEANAHGQV